jgi:hypothetical protein
MQLVWKSKSHCDWRSVSQSVRLGVGAHGHLLLLDSYGLVFCGAPSLTRGRVSFVYAAGPRQRSLSRVPAPWDSRPYFTVLKLPFFPLCRLSTNCPGYNISARTPQKAPPLIFVVQSFPWEHVCLRSRYSATIVAQQRVYMLQYHIENW